MTYEASNLSPGGLGCAPGGVPDRSGHGTAMTNSKASEGEVTPSSSPSPIIAGRT